MPPYPSITRASSYIQGPKNIHNMISKCNCDDMGGPQSPYQWILRAPKNGPKTLSVAFWSNIIFQDTSIRAKNIVQKTWGTTQLTLWTQEHHICTSMAEICEASGTQFYTKNPHKDIKNMILLKIYVQINYCSFSGNSGAAGAWSPISSSKTQTTFSNI